MAIWSKSPAMNRAPSSLTLRVFKDWVSTTSLGNPYQCLTALIVTDCF